MSKDTPTLDTLMPLNTLMGKISEFALDCPECGEYLPMKLVKAQLIHQDGLVKAINGTHTCEECGKTHLTTMEFNADRVLIKRFNSVRRVTLADIRAENWENPFYRDELEDHMLRVAMFLGIKLREFVDSLKRR